MTPRVRVRTRAKATAPSKKTETSTHEKASVPPLFVKVARTGGVVKEIALNGDNTVKAAIEAAGVGSDSKDRIRVNGRPADSDTKVKDGDIITVAGKISGGR